MTFLWRSDEINNVSVISLLTNPTTYPMSRIPATDIWHATCRAHNEVRATYQFSPVDPNKVSEDLGNPWANWRPDPYNPKIFAFYDAEEDPTGVKLERSILELQDTPDQPWVEVRKDVPAGKVSLYHLRSDILENERRVWVYTPPSYTSDHDKPYPLLIFFDGWGYLKLMSTTTIIDNLSSAGRIPPPLAVFVDSLSVELRIRELIYHDPFNDFLVGELLPWIHNQFHVTSNPGETVVVGSSAGGLAAAYAGLRHAQVFGNILSQSGAFRLMPEGVQDFGWLAQQFTVRQRLPLRFHLDAGLLEENSLRDLGKGPSLLQANRHMRDMIIGKGYDVHYTEFCGGHDSISWQGTLSDGLHALLGRLII